MSNKSHSNNAIDAKILQEATEILSNKFSAQINVKHIEYLSEEVRRNIILRIIIENTADEVPKSVILKQAAKEELGKNDQDRFARFARDWAGLEFLSEFKEDIAYAPKFYGASKKYSFILFEDLGEKHLSLVDSLMGNDLEEARAALARYMTLIAKFHGYGSKHIQIYRQSLQDINPDAPVWQDGFDDMFSGIIDIFLKLKIDSSVALEDEIKYVLKLAKDPGPFTALIHGDICPDNVFDNLVNNEMRLIDFEWSYVGNALLDAVYLKMAMPTCWCVMAFPDDVIREFDDLYRVELMKHIPEAKNNKLYYEYYTAACAYNVFWRIMHIERLFGKELSGKELEFGNHYKWKSQYNMQRPKQLYRLQSFIDMAEKYSFFPNIKLMAESIYNKLQTKWKSESLALYPAFR